MRIACIDKTAGDRVKLQRFFDEAYEHCRASVGHINLFLTYPASKDEILLNTPPDVVALGPGFTVEEAFTTCHETRQLYPQLPILVILKSELYSLRTLRRFQKVSSEVFTTDETPIRLIHKLSSLDLLGNSTKSGKLVVINGVKGGVGTTSIVSGLAHAADALGKTSIVLDLSPNGALIQYMSAQRWQSADFSAAISENLSPDKALVERCITTAPNGINLLLPPAGGTDIRELWLRHPDRFETTLAVIEILKELFDVVLVDTAGVEGVLYFALNARAHSKLLVTSNDPAAVHLLGAKVSELTDTPGSSQLLVLINLLNEKGLTKDDVLDFLYLNDNFTELMAALNPLPFDPKGRNWIGTGNTFFTESSAVTQEVLEQSLSTLLLSVQELESRETNERGIFAGLKRLARRATNRRKKIEGRLKALPLPEHFSTDATAAQTPSRAPNVVYADFKTPQLDDSLSHNARFHNSPDSTVVTNATDSLLYTRPAALDDFSSNEHDQDSMVYESPQMATDKVVNN